jgi:hypothetical protein
MAHELGRRDLIKITAGALAAVQAAAAAGPHKFFTADEFALTDELTEMIIPADTKSGGARAAAVADYIDACLAEAFEPEERDHWRQGLQRIDALAKEMHGAKFLEMKPEQRTALLERLAAHEMHPTTPDEEFFVALKGYTVKGYYTSRIGIHDEMEYKGNVFQQGDYAGELPK